LQFVWLKLRRRSIEAMHIINLSVIILFGGATLWLQNDAFIKWKPTVLYWLFAVILIFSASVFKRNLIKKLMGGQVTLSETVWGRLNTSWASFFTFAGAVNLYV